MSSSRPTVLVAHPGVELYGSDRVLLDSVIGFLEHGCRVIVAVPADGPLTTELRSAGADVAVTPQFVLRKRLMKPTGWPELFRTAWNGARGAWNMLVRERPAIVYVSTITLPLWPFLARLRGARVVLHVHEGESSASAIVKKVLYAPALLAHDVLVNSAFSRGVMVSAYRKLDARSTTLLNAVPGPDSITPLRESLAPGPRLLYLGRLSPRKGPDLLVEAVRILEQRGVHATLDIVGSAFEGYEWFERSLRDDIASAALDDRVTLHGFHPDVWRFLDASDVLVVPSRFDEPFGNTAVEGTLGGRPVIVSNTSGLREATAKVPTVIHVTPGSAGSIADAVESAVGQWPALRRSIRDAQALVADRHSVARYRARIAELVLREAMSTPASGDREE